MPRKLPPLLRFRENMEAKREEARRKQEEAQRKRERERRRALIILGAVLVLLVPVFIMGIIIERREATQTAAVPASEAPSAPTSTSSGPAPASEPSATKTDENDEPVEYDENHLQFGQTGHFTSTLSAAYKPEVPLEFTLSAPTPFKLSKDADLTDADPYSGRSKGVRQSTNVYFTLTVKNLSPSEIYTGSPDADVTDTGDDDTVSYVDDGDIEGLWALNGGKDLKPGKSTTVKLGFSVKSADKIQLELHFDGLHGDSYYYTR